MISRLESVAFFARRVRTNTCPVFWFRDRKSLMARCYWVWLADLNLSALAERIAQGQQRGGERSVAMHSYPRKRRVVVVRIQQAPG